MYTTLKSFHQDKFWVTVSTTNDETPLSQLVDENRIDEINDKIANGKIEYFIVKVEVYHCEVCFAKEYYGGNLFNTYLEFLDSDVYQFYIKDSINRAKYNVNLIKENF